jgi:hypothetical protein
MMAAGLRVMTRLGRGSRGSDRVVDGVIAVRAGRAEDFLRQGELPVKIGPPASPA